MIERLRIHGAEAAVGGSGLLAALGLVHEVRDRDVTTDADTATVEAALDATGAKYTRGALAIGCYATRALFVVAGPDHHVDVLVGFALRNGDRVVQLPSRVSFNWRGLPIADPLVWLEAYRLLGRRAQTALLRTWANEAFHGPLD